jgi:hypothetical protein
MSDKTSIVHIGLHKTGSTSLQRRLSRSRHLLARQGFFYPVDRLPNKNQHSHLALYLREGDPASYQSAFSTVTEDFRRSGCRYLILSGEEFSTLRNASVKKFGDDIKGITQPVRIILYVRNLSRLIISIMSQHSKTGKFVAYPQSIFERMRNFNPTRILRMWEDAFGAEQVSVQSLEALPAGSGIEEHFAQFAGADLKPMEFDAQANRSVDPIASALLTHLAHEFGVPYQIFYEAYFTAATDRFTLPRTEQHLAELARKWVETVDLSHPKLAPFKDALREQPMAGADSGTAGGEAERARTYMETLAAVLLETAAKIGKPNRFD